MAGLRNIFDAQNPHLLTQEQVDLGAAAGMNPLMQGYQSGRLSNEANYQLSQQMALREANNEAAAAALQPKINALRQRASIYAPSVQKVEDINGIGSGLTWLGGQVGQGAASMQDPMLASAALTGVGTGLSFMPNPIAKGAGFLLRNAAAPGVAYGINREQLKGEQYGNLSEDPAVMAGHTPQEIASQVGDYANVAGLLDTAIPGMVGRQLGGGALRGAASKFSPAAKAGMGLVGEGLTETAQEALAKQQHTGLNPNRDTSGDTSDLINSFAGGMAGAGGPVMAGGAAEAGFRGIRRGAEGVGQVGKVVTDAAGKTVDMLAPKAEPYISKAAEGLRQAKEMATGKVVDLKGQFQQMSQNRAEAHAEDELIAGEPPKGMDLQSEDFRKWVTESHPQRVEAIVNRLGRLQDAGDQTAGQLLERIGQGDQAAVEDGAAHALKQGRIEEVLADYGGKAGGLAASTGRFLKGAATKVAGAVKAGFQKGRKLNAQDPGQSAWTGDEYERRKDEAMASLGDLMATHMSQEAQAAPAVQGLPEAKRQNLSRAAAEMARQLADIAHNWTPPGTKKPSVQQFDRMQNDLSRIARHMVSIYGERAPDVAERLQSFADPKTKAVFGHLQDAISKDSVSRGSVTETKAWQVLKSSIPTEKQAELARDGIDLTAPDVRRGMMAMIEAAANGQLTPQARRQLSGLIGADGLQKVVEAYHPVPDAAKRLDEAWSTAEDGAEDKTPTTSDEDTTSNEGSDFEKRQGEKALAKRGNERVYGLLGMTPMSDTMLAGGRRDPMAFSGAHRPRLYDLRTTVEQDSRATPEELAGRQAQLAKDTERMQQHVGASGETDWGVSTRSALDELAGRMGVDPKKALSALDDEGGRGSIDPQFAEAMLRQYRDHMRDLHRRAANSNDPTFQGQAKGFEARAENADLVLKDRAAMRRYAEDDVMINQRAAQTARARVEAGLPVGKFERKGLQLQTSPGDRIDMLKKARAFLSTHGVIVAERATQRDIERITPAQVTEMTRSARALLQAHPDTLKADTEWDHERLGTPKNDVLRFRSAEKVDKNGDPELVPIRGRDLAALGRRARLQQGDEREGNANARYIEDLSSGIAALIDTGLVKGLPAGFEDGSLPESLPLDNISFKNFKFGKEKAVERAKERLRAFDPYVGEEGEANDARTSEKHQGRVEKDQDHDYFVPGDDESLAAEEARKKSAKADEREERGKLMELTHEADKSEQEAHIVATRSEGFGATSRRGSEEMPKAFGDKQKLDALLASGDWKKLLGAKPELKERFEAAALKRRDELSTPKLQLNFQQRRALKVLSEMQGLDKAAAERRKTEATKPAAAKEDAAPLGKSQDRRSGAGRKLNAQALQHHAESGNLGFGAAHNSPHRFPSFNWREHLGKGEGYFVKGAGTYLSTSDIVSRYYKAFFTKAAKNATGESTPTYHVSVDIDKARMLNWDQPLSEQSKTIQLRALKAIKDNDIEGDLKLTGEDLYRELTQELGDMPKASEYLQSLGILGHEYAASAGRDKANPNYVIYDDSKIKVNYVAFNGQNPSSNASTQAQMEEAEAYLNKILPDVHVAFKEIFGDDGTPVSGEWVKSQNTVFVSTMAGANTLSVAYHEGLHAFFSKFVDHDERTKQILMSLADDKKVLARLEALLAQHPAALSQLVDGEERLAYIYQFWAAGMLELPRQPRTVFEKIKRFFARVFAQITDQDRAVAILDALHTGKLGDPSVAGQVIAKAKMEGMLTTQLARKVDALVAKVQSLTVPANSMLEMSDSETARKLAMMMWTNPGNEEHGKAEQEGYLNARSAVATQYTNEFKSYLKDLNDTDLKQINEYLQQGVDATTIPFAPHQDAVNKIRALNKRFYRYMTDERGMQLGKFDPDRYFPRVWDASKLVGDGEAFVKMLMTHYKARIGSEESARALLDLLIRNSLGERVLPERTDGVLAPFFASEENRKLAWIEPHHSAEFQTKNLIHTLSTYYHNGARAAEYTHRFGQRGEKLEGMLEDVHKELVEASKKLVARQEFKTQAEADKWRQRRYEQVVKAMGAMEGTLGSDINSAWRNASVWTTVYQNVRLLPLALFSNMVDPLALVARGGTMSDAYDTFLRGMTQVIHNWKDMLSREPKERQADAWERMAEAMGTVDAAMFSHHVADEYSSMYMSTKAKAVNETFFRANGMEAWNRGVRVGATRAAVNFLTRHAKLPDVHSARWLTELGLAPSDLTFDAGGQLILDKNQLAKQKGIPIARAEVEMEKVHAAVRRWVQGAVITPNAAQRPSWSSDPHYSMFFHLKQFSYSFHQTILKRAVKELEYGNLAPLGSFIWYVPVMMAADITRGLIQGGGQLPAYMKGMTASDWVLRSASRSGLLSVGEIGINAASDLASLGGPAVEQVIDGFSQPIGRTVVDALPASPLVKHLGGR